MPGTVYFQISAADDPRVALLNVGDGVLLNYDRSQTPLELTEQDSGENQVLCTIYRAENLGSYYGTEEPTGETEMLLRTPQIRQMPPPNQPPDPPQGPAADRGGAPFFPRRLPFCGNRR